VRQELDASSGLVRKSSYDCSDLHI
jgi:hypothetical protein